MRRTQAADGAFPEDYPLDRRRVTATVRRLNRSQSVVPPVTLCPLTANASRAAQDDAMFEMTVSWTA